MAEAARNDRFVPTHGFKEAFKSGKDRMAPICEMKAIKLHGQNIPAKLPPPPPVAREFSDGPVSFKASQKSKPIAVAVVMPRLDQDVKVDAKFHRPPLITFKKIRVQVGDANSKFMKGFRSSNTVVSVAGPSSPDGQAPEPMHAMAGGKSTDIQLAAPAKTPAPDSAFAPSQQLPHGTSEAILVEIRELREENRGLVRTVARLQKEIDGLKK